MCESSLTIRRRNAVDRLLKDLQDSTIEDLDLFPKYPFYLKIEPDKRELLFAALASNRSIKRIEVHFGIHDFKAEDISSFLMALRDGDGKFPLESIVLLSTKYGLSHIEVCEALKPYKKSLRKFDIHCTRFNLEDAALPFSKTFISHDAFPALEHFSLKGGFTANVRPRGQATSSIFNALTTNTVLREVNLIPFDPAPLSDSLIRFLLHQKSSVVNLSMVYPSFDDVPSQLIREFQQALAANTTLESLTLGEGFSDDISCSRVLTGLANNVKLNKFHAPAILPNSVEDIRCLNDLLARNQTLQMLRFVSFKNLLEPNLQLPSVFEAVATNRGLKELHLGLSRDNQDPFLEVEARKALTLQFCEMIANNQHLEKLFVRTSDNSFISFQENDSIIQLFRSLGRSKMLHTFSLSYEMRIQGDDRDVVDSLIQSFHQNISLRVLDLAVIGLSTVGLLKLMSYLRNDNRTLEQFTLTIEFKEKGAISDDLLWTEFVRTMETNPRLVLSDGWSDYSSASSAPHFEICKKGLYFADLNKYGRRYIMGRSRKIPKSLWPRVLARVSKTSSDVYRGQTEVCQEADRLQYFLRYAIVNDRILD
ncbi:hypothetical protein IV203_026043 [Nitzschia inconspicua]|uniref:Uncharacterized protein n=1 Tax=Nitzschia inconspicua TaxID=303405 RepID=A0A9K3PWV9_9STRA|nr:hypothetical protein IV203_026043 [Nitzschia inconspicua]